jgi:hypothetical protein
VTVVVPAYNAEATIEEGEVLSAIGAKPSVRIYAISDSRFFLGLIALVNSLRLQGHREPIIVLDCGLADYQREILSHETTLIAAPAGSPPHLLKYVAPLLHPADVMLLIDADVIVTRSLELLIHAAEESKIVAFTDRLHDRFDPQWSALLGLEPLRRQPYVNSGFLVLPRSPGLEVLTSLQAGQESVDLQQGILSGGTPDYPFYFPDQDVLNAILASKAHAENLAIMEHRLAPHPMFEGVELLDEQTLRCSYADGLEPFGLHHVLQNKPWLAPIRHTIYSDLLPRLWLGSDLALPLEPEHLPLRFRSGMLAKADEQRYNAMARLQRLRGRLGLSRHLNELRHRKHDARARATAD